MSARRLVIVGSCLLICLLVATVVTLPWLRVQYHLRILRQMESRMANTQSVGSSDATRHRIFQDYDNQIHTLVQLGYLERTEMSFQNYTLTGTVKQAFVTMVRQKISNSEPWKLTYTTNAHSVIVTCPTTETAKWRKLVSDYDAP
jgi:hypothetical protein